MTMGKSNKIKLEITFKLGLNRIFINGLIKGFRVEIFGGKFIYLIRLDDLRVACSWPIGYDLKQIQDSLDESKLSRRVSLSLKTDKKDAARKLIAVLESSLDKAWKEYHER